MEKMKKKGKGTRKNQQYSPKKLEAAIQSITKGELTPWQSSNKYGIPRTTLIYKSTGQRPQKCTRPGPDSMLGKQNEEILVNWMLAASARGFPVTRTALCYSARKLLEEGHGNKVNTYKPEKGPGRKWYEAFMKRHKTLSERTAEYIHQGRAAATEKSIRIWFEKVKENLQPHLDVFNHPERIYNCDETSFVLHPKSRPVIVAKGQKHVYDASRNSNKENLTILICGNAAGELVPPMTLVSYQKIPSDLAATANPAWPIGKTDNGWMTCAAFFEYIANIFEPHVRNVQKPVVLFLDNHSSHISLQLSEFCLEKGIILVALPPNCTHILQPLDVSFFAPLKSNWSSELEMFKLKNNSEPKKCHVLPIIENILKQDAFKTNLINGFKACGLSNLDPNVVDYTKCIKGDDESEVQQNTEKPHSDAENDLLMKQFEDRLPIYLKKKFDEADINNEWRGKIEFAALFNFYKAVKFNLNFEDLATNTNPSENEIICEFPFSNVDIDNMEIDTDLNLDISVTLCDSDLATNHSADPLPEQDHFHPNTVPIVPATRIPVAFPDSENLNNDDFEHGPSIANANFNNLPTTSVASDNNVPTALVMHDYNTVLDLSTVVRPISNITNNISDSSITPINSPESTSSSSGKSSVKEILDSIIRYKPKLKDGEENKTRKKLHLPSVLTSQDWISLKRAQENEKEEAERKKQERKKARELKQAALKEKKDLALKKKSKKVEANKSKKKVNQGRVEKVKVQKGFIKGIKIRKPTTKVHKRLELSSCVENLIRDIIENPTEVEIGNWVVVEYAVLNQPPRRYIAIIFKISNGHFYGDFLRPATSPYVFKFPDVDDITKVSFNQIKKVLPPPEQYGRGLLKFCIDVKNL